MSKPLVSTKLTDADKKEERAGIGSAPEYPWGMRLRFDDALMTKLDMKALPANDAYLMIVCKARVCETWSRDGSSGADKGFEVVVEEVGFCDPVAEAKEVPSAASVMFDGT